MWNSTSLRFVHLRCVHFSHVVHSIALWFDLQGALHVVHGYFDAVYFFLVGRSILVSIISCIWMILFAVVLVLGPYCSNRYSYVIFVSLLLCIPSHSLRICSWVSMSVLLQYLHFRFSILSPVSCIVVTWAPLSLFFALIILVLALKSALAWFRVKWFR